MKTRKAGIILILVAVITGIFFLVSEMHDRNGASTAERNPDLVSDYPDPAYGTEEDIGDGSEDNGASEEEAENTEETGDMEDTDPSLETPAGEDTEKEEQIYGDGGEASDPELIGQMEIEISGMHKSVKKRIRDYEAFEYAVKEYLFSEGVETTTVISLNSVTVNYDLDNEIFHMAVETEDETWEFYIVQDNQDGTYTASE